VVRVRSGRRVGGLNGTRPLVKPLPPEHFVDYTDGEHGYNAETRWEALAETGYLTPSEKFFVRSHAPTPRITAPDWRLRGGGAGGGGALGICFAGTPPSTQSTPTRVAGCAGTGGGFF